VARACYGCCGSAAGEDEREERPLGLLAKVVFPRVLARAGRGDAWIERPFGSVARRSTVRSSTSQAWTPPITLHFSMPLAVSGNTFGSARCTLRSNGSNALTSALSSRSPDQNSRRTDARPFAPAQSHVEAHLQRGRDDGDHPAHEGSHLPALRATRRWRRQAESRKSQSGENDRSHRAADVERGGTHRSSADALAEPGGPSLNSRPPSRIESRRPDRRICGGWRSMSCAPTLWKGVQAAVGDLGFDLVIKDEGHLAIDTFGGTHHFGRGFAMAAPCPTKRTPDK